MILHHAMEPGRFYMTPAYRGDNWLFQCVQTAEPLDDGFRRKALVMTIGGTPELSLYDLPYQTPAVALDDVHVRVDPTSLDRSAYDTYLTRGLFLVRNDEPILCAATDQVRGWAAVNMNTGRAVTGNIDSNWLSFTRWSLVMDDEEGDELTLASFGDVSTSAAAAQA